MIANFRTVTITLLTLVAVSGCQNTATVPRIPIEASLEVGLPILPADGHATTVLLVRVSPGSRVEPREVTFSTTSGTFQGTQLQHVTVALGATGEAAALLTAPIEPGLALVRARIGTTDLQDTIRFAVAPPQLLELTVGDREVPADGASAVRVRAVLAPGAGTRTVRFQTTAGTLLGSGATGGSDVSVTADSAGVAVVLLKADTNLGVALVRGTVGSTAIVDSVRFVRALPDQIGIEASSFRVAPGPENAVNLTVRIRRSLGRVSPGAEVFLSAQRPDGTPLGQFGGILTSDADGVVTASYTPGTTDYQGVVIITANTASADGPMISARITLEVRRP